jgi:hypothetical protein
MSKSLPSNIRPTRQQLLITRHSGIAAIPNPKSKIHHSK